METRAYSSTLEKSTLIERVARIVSSVRGTKPDYTQLAAELEQAIPFDIFGVVLLRHDRQAVRVTVCHRGDTGAWIAGRHQHPREDSKLAQVLHAPMVVVKNYPDGLDGPPVESGDALSGYHQLHSTIIAPLMIEDQVLGALELGSVVLDTYSDETLQRLVRAVARVLASAIEGAQQVGSAAIQDRQRQALKDVTTALTSKTDLPTILNQVVVGIAQSLNVASMIVMLDHRDGKLRLEAQSGLDEQIVKRAFEGNMALTDDDIIGQTLLRRQPYVSQDITNDERFPGSTFFSQLGLRSIFSYPLVTGTTVYGALLLCASDTSGFTPLKADILSLFANQATVAIHNGLLLESVHQRSRFQEAIELLEQAHKRHASGSLSSETDSNETEQELLAEFELLKQVREETQSTFGVSFSSLLRFITENLLTRSERDLEAMFSPNQRKRSLDAAEAEPVSMDAARGRSITQRPAPLEETATLLTQTAEAALVRAGMLGELSRLLVQLQQTTSSLKDAWFIVDLQGICAYMNPAAEVLCGRRMEELSSAYAHQLLTSAPMQGEQTSATIEDLFTELMPRMRNAEEVRLYLRDFTQGSIYRQELRFILAEEPVTQSQQEQHSSRTESVPADYHYHLTRYPLYNQSGQLEANALQVQDITEQVRDEKNRSALLSSVSHDLRTPLTTIKAAVTGLLQDDVAWDEQDRREMLEDIDSETDHLTVLVNAIVELSRIEMGALILEKEWCDIVEVLYGALARLQRIIAGRPIRTHFQPHLPLIYVDHAQLERVFYNLIENAARNSPEGTEIIIMIDTVTLQGGAPELLRVQIIDYGEGIPEHERERIFKSFHSLRPYGNGLGLAICSGIIDAHQGRIWVETAPDAGSCFIFTLPTHPHTVVHAGVGTSPVHDKGSASSQKQAQEALAQRLHGVAEEAQ